MTYEEFKKELYRNVCNRVAKGEKRISLFERGSICIGTEDLKIVKCINLYCRGKEETVIYEDIICVDMGKDKMINMLYWQVRPLYERFKQEGWQSVLPEILAKLQETEKSNKCFVLRPINLGHNIAELENCIFRQFGDIAMVLYALIYDDGEDYMTMKVNREMAEHWKLSDEVILTNALLNTCAKMPPMLYVDETEGLRGYRVTTTRGLNGAIAFFYPGVREQIAELLGGDYYVGFTGIHEAVVYPVQHKNIGEMKATIRQTNAILDEKEMLTNRIYRYLCARKELVEV